MKKRIAITLAVALTVLCVSLVGCHNAGDDDQHDGDPSCDPRVTVTVTCSQGGFSASCAEGLIGSSPGSGTINGICRSASGLAITVVVDASATFSARDANGQAFALNFDVVGDTASVVRASTFSVSGAATVRITVP
jgi:hypothetical protein